MKYTASQVRQLRKYADLMRYMLIVSNKQQGVKVAFKYMRFLDRMEREQKR